jgi:protein NRD1
MLTAPYGGSGGRPIVSGLCVEEPDIEIGAGVSSKAISRRMQTDKGGNHGPKSSRRGPEDESPVGFAGGHAHGGGHGHMGGGGGGPQGGGPPSGANSGGPPGGRWRHKGGADKHQRRGGGGDDRNDNNHNPHHNNHNTNRSGGGGGNDEPIVMDLPAGITMGPNGINYPPNFAFGAAASSHP